MMAGQGYQNDFSDVDNIMAHIQASNSAVGAGDGGGNRLAMEPPHSPSRLRDLNGLSQIMADAEPGINDARDDFVPHSDGGRFPV